MSNPSITDRDAPTMGPRSTAAASAPAPAQPEDAPRASAPSDPLVGALVASRFRVIERIGEGGMGAVYLAEHTALGKKVAIKILHADMHSNAEVRARFEREAMAMARLEHENIASASDFGQLDDGAFFLAMEFIEGRSLRELLAETPRPATLRALKLLRQIASALGRAHSLEIVHRDLKPENILVVPRAAGEELVKIIDFGIARFTGASESDKPLTQTGVIFGTPHYMSPEQAMGRRVDAAADQYAFGVLAFELLTGRKPFDHKNLLELLDLQVNGAVPRASSAAPDLPAAIDGVFDRLLAKSPIERFSSVSDAMDAIDECLAPALATATAQLGFAATHPATSSVVAHEKTLYAAQGAIDAPTVSNTAPTIQDHLQTTAPSALAPAGATAPPKILGLPVIRMGRLGEVPVVVIVIVALSVVVNLSWSLASTSGRRARVARASSTSERIAALRAQSDVSSALSRAAHGDVRSAIDALVARKIAHPNAEDDALVSMQLAMLYAADRQGVAAVGAFANATSRDPQLAEDEALVRTLLRLLDDPGAGSSAETLLRVGALARSRTAARVLAEETVFGRSQDARRRAGRLARERLALLDAASRARVVLRTSDRCDELQSVMAQRATLATTPAGADIERLRAGQCAMLLRRQLCQCVAGRN